MKKIKLLLGVILVVLLVTVLFVIFFPRQEMGEISYSIFKYINTELDNCYFTSLFLYCFVYVSYVTIGLPGLFLLTIIGGALFGLLAAPITILLFTLGSNINFLIIRKFFQKSVRSLLQKKYQKIMNLTGAKNSFLIILHLRLLPLTPYNILNLIIPVTNFSFVNNIWACFLGIMPNNFLYVILGVSMASNFTGSQSVLSSYWYLVLFIIALMPILLIISRRWFNY